MSIRMIRPCMGAADSNGTKVRLYRINDVLPLDEPWQHKLAQIFIMEGYAVEVPDGLPVNEFKRPLGRVKKNHGQDPAGSR
jgi:hypothetical protein